ncbi:MAG: S-methyl-5-thioribose-1-phosphate isomerase [Candidatus Aminicenantes bacterium RBG_16_63_16]|nr:MAG: S-methyl-5-thioribose-1-phosphate isomerase [Candidatus Aminicenantes bacterium RBG_16_63_16]
MHPTIEWKDGKVVMIDQRRLPLEEVYVECTDVESLAAAIETMVIRGAPAIGVAAAYGVALGLLTAKPGQSLDARLDEVIARLARTRPTAMNLFWALDRMKRVFADNRQLGVAEAGLRLVREAQTIELEDLDTNRRIGAHGSALIRDGDSVLTHCNAGELATAGYGTALGVIRAAFEQGKKFRVFVDETRPFLQGARLTAWELDRLGVPLTLITDNMAGWLMKQGEISLAVTGADRIARNGDAANKIGTYSVAVLARHHGLPFYIAAPLSTFDFGLRTGAAIPIEERPAREVREAAGCPITLPHVPVRNPAFDVVPAKLITAIVSERGVARPPYRKTLAVWAGKTPEKQGTSLP